jgi:hypothetical protein
LTSDASVCANKGCAANGVYDPSKSSTASLISSDFDDSYADGTSATGAYFNDSFSIGGATLDQFQFGAVDDFNSTVEDSTTLSGILGIGPVDLESDPSSYLNLPYALAEAGLINSPAYSLWLDDVQAGQGQVLFGGVNKAKYSGELATIDMILPSDGSEIIEFYVALSGINIKDGDNTVTVDSTPQAALLDCGATYTLLLEDDFNVIAKYLNMSYDTFSEGYVVDCDVGNSDITFEYSFGSQVITVPINQLVFSPEQDQNGNFYTGPDGKQLCYVALAIQQATDTVSLGDSFLRSAYVVYDLVNYQISIANTVFNSTAADDIQEITYDPDTQADTVPGATAVVSSATAAATSVPASNPEDTPTASGNADIPTITASLSPSGGSGKKNSASSLRGDAPVGAGCVVAFVAAFAAGMLLF